MSELSGVWLRRAALLSDGWKVANPSHKGSALSYLLDSSGEKMAWIFTTKPEMDLWSSESVPKVESDIAAAWPLLERWLAGEEGREADILVSSSGAACGLLADELTIACKDGGNSAEAICRALVEAAK